MNLSTYLLKGHRMCRVVGQSTYGKYSFVTSALHLPQHINRYKSGSYDARGRFAPCWAAFKHVGWLMRFIKS